MSGEKLNSETFKKSKVFLVDHFIDGAGVPDAREISFLQLVANIELRESLDQTNEALRDIYAAIQETKQK